MAGVGSNRNIPYWSDELDQDGYGIRLFQRYSREADDDGLEEGNEPVERVQEKVKDLIDAVSHELKGTDVERRELALGRLYAALHYETEVRRWAARSREVFEEVKPHGKSLKDDPDSGREELKQFRQEFQKFRQEFYTPWWVKAGYWARPVVVFFFCFATQSFLLHLATRVYIHYMEMADKELDKLSPEAKQAVTKMQNRNSTLLEAQLPDLAERVISRIDLFKDGVPLSLLDFSGALPAFLFLIVYVYVHAKGGANIGLWTKTFIVASLMALMKGSVDLITIVPDSAGWSACKARLGTDLKSLSEVAFDKNFGKSMAMMIKYEIIGGARGRMRYCSDMLISGHTYFAVLFSLSAYSMIRYVTTHALKLRYLFLGVFSLCIFIEIFLVAGARFHYVVDMVLSVILVITLWDSTRIETMASYLTVGYEWCNEAASAKTFFIGGGSSAAGKELWKVNKVEELEELLQHWKDDKKDHKDNEDNKDDKYKRYKEWVRNCPTLEIRTEDGEPAGFLRKRGRNEDPKNLPMHLKVPLKVCASVEPWRSTKLIDIRYLHNTVLEDPDVRFWRVLEPPVQKGSEPNTAGTGAGDGLLDHP